MAQVRDLTRRLSEAGSGACTDPAVLSAAAAQAERLLNVAGAEPVKRALRVAVAELHIAAGDAYLQAHALALRGTGHAEREIATARGLWSATRADPFGDLDRPAALLALRRGRLDVAESFAAVSVRRWEGINRIGHALSGIVLATIHVRAGEPRGLSLAHGAITAVTKISSAQA